MPFPSPPSWECSSATNSRTGTSRRRSSSPSATWSAAWPSSSLAFTRSFWPFFLLMLVHCLLYVPTISITNSIAFANMKDAQSEFGIVRMGGTIGWILAAWPFTFILVDWDKVRAANPQGFVDWLGTVLSSGLVGDALQGGRAVDLRRGRRRVPAAGRVQPDPAPHAAQEGRGRRGGEAGLAGGAEAAQASLHARPVARHLRRLLRAQLLLQLDGRVPRHARPTRAAWASPATGSCPS